MLSHEFSVHCFKLITITLLCKCKGVDGINVERALRNIAGE